MVADPCALLVAMPDDEIVAAVAFDELHAAELVRFLVLWSLYVPVAVNCWPEPAATDVAPGVTAIDCKVAGAVLDDELPPPHPTITRAHTTANTICNFFISIFLWSLGPKIGPQASRAAFDYACDFQLQASRAIALQGIQTVKSDIRNYAVNAPNAARTAEAGSLFFSRKIGSCQVTLDAIAECIRANVFCRSAGLVPREGTQRRK